MQAAGPIPGLFRRDMLVAAGLALRGHQNQPRTRRSRTRGPAAQLKDTENRGVGREHADSDRKRNREAEHERHEQRNHSDLPRISAVF